jgi:hypothetical protein
MAMPADRLRQVLASADVPSADIEPRIRAFAEMVGTPGRLGEAAPGGLPASASIPLLGRATAGLGVRARLRMNPVSSAIAHLLDETSPLVDFEISNKTSADRSVRLSAWIEGYTSRAVDTALMKPGATATVPLFPIFDARQLRDVNELTRVAVHVLFEDLDAKTVAERTKAIWLTPRTTAHLSVDDPISGRRDLSRYLGAWVTPNAEPVLELLRAAADSAPFVGYQRGTDGAERQVAACYDVCRKHGIRYVNSVIAAGGGDVQRVRLPRESLQQRAANCIDGTVLMASMLEAASLAPAIVLVPGHAFLAWRTAPDADDWRYLDTIYLATHTYVAARDHAKSLADEYQALSAEAKAPQLFRRHAIDELRRDLSVLPME